MLPGKTKPSHTCSGIRTAEFGKARRHKNKGKREPETKKQLTISNQPLNIHSSWYQGFQPGVLRQGLPYVTLGIYYWLPEDFSLASESQNKNGDSNLPCSSVLGPFKKIIFIIVTHLYKEYYFL